MVATVQRAHTTPR